MSEIAQRTASIMAENRDKRFNVDGNQYIDLKHLHDGHQEILRLLSCGFSPETIADMQGITTQTVSNVRNSPLAQKMLLMLHSKKNEEITKVNDHITSLAPLAADKVEEILTDREADYALQYKAAKDILASHGALVTKPDNIHFHKHSHFSGDEIEDIKRGLGSIDPSMEVPIAESINSISEIKEEHLNRNTGSEAGEYERSEDKGKDRNKNDGNIVEPDYSFVDSDKSDEEISEELLKPFEEEKPPLTEFDIMMKNLENI